MRPRRLVLALCLLAGACDRKSLTGDLEPEPAGIPVIALSAASAAFIGPARSMAPMQMIAISNSGSGTLGGLGIDTLEYLGDSSGWLTASLSSVTAPGMLALQAAAGNLVPDTYYATVTAGAVVEPRGGVLQGTSGPRMPPSGALSAGFIAKMKAWIQQGAPNN